MTLVDFKYESFDVQKSKSSKQLNFELFDCK